nr:MAG: hypothetical protein [Bacteriophage sp.]
MSTTQHTGHYNLPTFGDNPNDRPSWRGDFTDAMTKIDNQMYTNATSTTTATAAANNASTAARQAKEAADNAATLAQANKIDIDEQESYFNALGVTSVPTAQNLMSTINGKAENTALTALQGKVSTLSGTVSGKADAAAVYTKAQGDARYTQQGGYSGTAQQLNQRVGTNATDISALKAWRDAWLTGWKMGTVSHSESSGVTLGGNDSNNLMYLMYNESVRAFKFFGNFMALGLDHPAAYITFSAQLPQSMKPSSTAYYTGAGFYVAGGNSVGNLPAADSPIGGFPASFLITTGGQIQATFRYDSKGGRGENWTAGQNRIYVAFTQSLYLADTLTPTA